MFSKKCSRCSKKISKGYDFCPFCGNNFKSPLDKENYGIIGKNDIIEDNLFESFEGSFMDKIFNTAMKMLEKQIREMPNIEKEMRKEIQQNKKSIPYPSNLDIQFYVNGEKVFPQEQEKAPIKIKNNISDEQIQKFSKFPKQEPNSKLKRLSGKIIYEVEVPGVTDLKDVIISQLENSIEIKALGKDKIYSKTLNLNLPILGYKLEKDNLILELKG